MRLVTLPSDPFDAFVARDPVSCRVVAQLRAWARNPRNVLISGESGVGKSLAAHLLHHASDSASAALLVCSTVEAPANQWATLLESGGTLVLDGIERWSLDAQAAVVERLASRPAGCASIRVVATSRVAADRLQLEGRAIPSLTRTWRARSVQLPPLRARPDDLPPLVEAMLRRAGRAEVHLVPEAWRALAQHGWPGNVRELREVIGASLVQLHGDRLEPKHLTLDPLAAPSLEAIADGTFQTVRQQIDTWYLRRLMHQTQGNISEASRRAGCSRKVMRERLRRLGLYAPPATKTPVLAPAPARPPTDEDLTARDEPRRARWRHAAA